MRHYTDIFKILDAAAANGAGSPMEVSDFRHLVLALATANSAAATIKIQGSISQAVPTWTSAASPANQWSYLQIIDLADQSVINGATGIVLTGTDSQRMFEVNTNAVKWLNVIVSGYSAGNISILVRPFNDAV